MKIIDDLRRIKNNLNYNLLFKKMLIEEFNSQNKSQGSVRILEIGTAFGDSSTRAIYFTCRKLFNDFLIIGLEPVKHIYERALTNTKELPQIILYDEYFLSKKSVEYFLSKIEDIISQNALRSEVRLQYLQIKEHKFYKKRSNFVPNFVFIDSIRYSHLAIIKTLFEHNYQNARIIMEDDIPNFGELKIIKKYFEINNVRTYRCFPHQWPFVTFSLRKEIVND